MLQSLFECVFEILVKVILSILVWILLFPVSVIVATPFILIIAAFDKPSYPAPLETATTASATGG